MTAVADIAFCAVGIALGYAGVCRYLDGVAWKELSPERLRPKGRRLWYLSAAILSCVLIAALLMRYYGLSLLARLKLLGLVLVLFPCAAVDYRRQTIPNRFLAAGLAVRCALFTGEFLTERRGAVLFTLKSDLLAAGVMGAFFLLMLLIFKNSVGMGDIKLLMLMGLYQGLQGVLSSVFLSLLVLFAISVFLLLTKRKNRKDSIPFCPSVLVGTCISIALTGT